MTCLLRRTFVNGRRVVRVAIPESDVSLASHSQPLAGVHLGT